MVFVDANSSMLASDPGPCWTGVKLQRDRSALKAASSLFPGAGTTPGSNECDSSFIPRAGSATGPKVWAWNEINAASAALSAANVTNGWLANCSAISGGSYGVLFYDHTQWESSPYVPEKSLGVRFQFAELYASGASRPADPGLLNQWKQLAAKGWGAMIDVGDGGTAAEVTADVDDYCSLASRAGAIALWFGHGHQAVAQARRAAIAKGLTECTEQ